MSRLPWGGRLALPPQQGRWVVVDVETSGLNAAQDRLLAVGALGVTDGAICLADSFEVVLRQAVPSSRANIEVHRIGGEEQLSGAEPIRALEGFLAFVRDDPLVAFHAPFDALVLRRAIREHLGLGFSGEWLDLAVVAPIAWPARDSGSGLDGWLEAFGIPMSNRHRAVVDCLGTAQLLLRVLAQAPALGAGTARSLMRLSKGRRWLS